MAEVIGFEERHSAMKRFGHAVFKQVNENMQSVEWFRAKLDVRYYRDGSGFMDKLCIEKAGEPEAWIRGSREISLLLIELQGMRKIFASEWFGLLLEVTASGKCVAKYDYDPNCSQDQSYFDGWT
jgi:hypothetical protein